jgi:hypothetical protein
VHDYDAYAARRAAQATSQQRGSNWQVVLCEGVAHLVPTRDVIAHDLDADCVCGPQNELIRYEGEPDGWLAVHWPLSRPGRAP